MSYYTYILYSPSRDRYYVGSCGNMDIRITEHNSGRNTSTRSGIPWEIRKIEIYPTRSEAVAREVYIKRMKSRVFIERVITGLR